MTRTIDSTTLAAIIGTPVSLVWMLRLDIQGDPVYINSSFRDYAFTTGADAPLVGLTFTGYGVIGTIDTITDSTDGSQALSLTLPGIDTSLDYLHQLISNGDLWQRYSAYLWIMTVDGAGAILGKPIRVKTGRMDQLTMVIDPDNQTGTLSISIESQSSYSGEALFSRYSEQRELDNTDTSQDLAAAITNAVPGIGHPETNPISGIAGGTNGIPVGGIPGSIGAARNQY